MKRAILHSKKFGGYKNVCIFANIKMQEIPAASLLNDMLFLVFITKSIIFMMYLCSEAYCKIPSQPKRLGSRFV